MSPERWQEVKQQIKSNMQILDEYEESLDPGRAEVIEFMGPSGKIQAKYITKPRVLDKKTTFSNRIGSGVRVDYIYSEDETSSHLELRQWSEARGDWQPLEAEDLF